MVNNNVRFKALTQAAFRLNNLLTAERDRLVEDLGLSSARWQVLETAGNQTGPVSAAHIARQLQISRQAVQRVLNDLAKQGLVQLAADAADKRAQLVSLTPHGMHVLRELDRRSDLLRQKITDDHHPTLADFLELANNGLAPAESGLHAPALSETSADQAPALWQNRPLPAIANIPRTFENVQEHILDRIRTGDLKSGDRLPPERELASGLGIGRSAVREALRSLEMSGILRFKRGVGGGAFVRESGSEGIEASIRSMLILGRLPLSALLEVRVSLLGECARMGAERGTEQDFAQLDRNIDELERCLVEYGDHRAAIGPAVQFYRLTARCSHNPLMILLVDAIADLATELLKKVNHDTRIDSITARREMTIAMRDGRADDASQVIRRHLNRTNQLLLTSKASIARSA